MAGKNRIIAFLSFTAAFVLADVVQADPGWDYPTTCCPKFCSPMSTSFHHPGDAVDSGSTEVRLLDGRVRISPDAHIGVSPDDRLHLCIVYDAFGNREAKCLFVPAMA